MRKLIAVALTACLTGCAVGPNYKRPKVDVMPQYRNPGGPEPAADEISLGDKKWTELFDDEVLKQMVSTALQNNYDLRIAAERVLQARAQLGITRSNLFPTVDANGQFDAVRPSRLGQNRFVPQGISFDSSYTQATLNLSWELDLWGRLRRLTEAARAQFLASEEARRGVVTSLVADVTTTYFALRELDLELEIGQRTKDIAENGLRLTQLRHDRGAATGLDVRQAEQLLYLATAQIAATQRSIGTTENALSTLLGKNPGDVQRGKRLEEFHAPPQVPAGIPSTLLARRPDIRQAEQTLIAANAQIGAARAQYFPQISLTGMLGGQSRALSNLFIGDARYWNFAAPSATLPIFNAGRIRSNVRLTEAQKREAVLSYQKTIQTAFREVSDSLISYRKFAEQRDQQEQLVRVLQESTKLSTLRYKGGLDSYLQVLDAERNLFQQQLTLASVRQAELASIVTLYKALGGGWN